MVRVRVLLVAVLALALGTSSLARASAGDPFVRALELESAAKLGDALAVLDGAHLTGSEARHRTALRDAVATLGAVRVYERVHELQVADSLLARLSSRLDPVRDVYVNAAVQKQLAAVRAMETRAPKPKPGFFASLWGDAKSSAKTVLRWLIVLAGCVLLIGAVGLIGKLTRSVRSPRKGIGVALEDLSVEATKRSEANRALGREFAVAIGAASQDSVDGPRAEIDVARDLDGSVSLNVRVSGAELAAIEPYLDDGSPVKVGPISVSPRQLLAFLELTFRAPYEYELRGYLATSGSTSRLVVELQRPGRPTLRWASAGQGDDGRASAVLETARRVLFEASAAPISASWPSVAAYRAARSRLASIDDPSDRPAALEDARRLLERSLGYDPGNALARFELGTVLRKLGRNADALAQYEFIEHLSSEAGRTEVPSLRRALSYSRAVALSKLESWDDHKRAVALLGELRADVEADQRVEEPEREQLLLFIRSAMAATKAFEAERFRSEHDADKTRARSAEVLRELGDERDWIAQSRARNPDVDLTTYVQATAVAENAVGRAAYVSGRPVNEAIAALERALSLVPELGDAHVNLASALLRSGAHSADWVERIERHIDLALEISPRDRKALYLRGQLYLKAGRPDAARQAFERAAEAGDAWAILRLGELAWSEGKKEEAIDLALRSVARGPAFDHRAKLLVLWVAELADQTTVKHATLVAARRAGSDLQRQAKKRKRDMTPSVTQALAVIDAKLGPDQARGERDRADPTQT